jgi:LPS-assembly protein
MILDIFFQRSSYHRARIWLTTFSMGLFLSTGLYTSAHAEDVSTENCTVNENTDSRACAVNQSSLPDWTRIREVPVDQRDAECRKCGGQYDDPLEAVKTSDSPDTADINAKADTTELIGDQVIFLGGVQVQQGYRRLYGDTAVVRRDQESALITGNVTLREPGVLLTGEEAEIFSGTGEAVISEAEFVFHKRHMRGSADLLERDEDGLIHVHDGSFTYCAPGDNDWAVKADNIELDFDEGLATAKDAKIEVGGVPVFYSPWFQFPLDDRRMTGFLWPEFGNDSTGGVDITVPFYLNLAPNYDALYSPRFIEERGLNHQLLLRYLHPIAGSWSTGGTWMDKDDSYSDGADPDKSTDRWIGIVRQDGLVNQRWRSRIDYSKASDVDYLQDLETSSLDQQRETSLLQLGTLDYLGNNWLVSLEARQFQSLADDIDNSYKTLPQMTAQYRSSGRKFELEPIFLSELSNFDTDDNRVTGQRMYSEAGVAYPMQWLAGFLKPTVKYRHLNYSLSDNDDFPDDEPSAGAALASLDGGLVFERTFSTNNRTLLQTLEPRLYYLYSEYDDQSDLPDFDSGELTFISNQPFRETRFSGHDRIDDANQISAGLSTQFIDESTGSSLLAASISQIYYFRDRKVRLNSTGQALDESKSEVAAEAVFTPNDVLTVRSSLVYDPLENNVSSGVFRTSLKADNGAIYNLGYSYRRDPFIVSNSNTEIVPVEEASFSAYIPVSTNWSLFGATNYSIEADISLEDMVGVEYDSCCWTFRLLYLRYYQNESGQFTDLDDPDLERENTAQFQIIMKSMGGFGDRITKIMEDLIQGFEERDY